MPRSSRSKSHKQKVKEYSDSEEDVKVKDRNGKDELSVRVSKDLSSGKKRKFSSQPRDGKDLSGHGNGDLADENVVPKRQKEKAEGGGSDRWNAGGDGRSDGLVMDKEVKAENLKSKELKGSVDSKSKSSRRHDSASEKKDDTEKEESKGGSMADSKRKSEKDSGRKESREIKEKDRGGADKEKKLQDAKDVEVARKQGLHSVDLMEERQSKLGKENAEWPIQDELRNPELEKELEKRVRRRGDGSSDKDKYQDDVRHSDDKRSSRGDRSKDVRHKDERHKDERQKVERHGDKYQEDGEKDNRHREDKYREGGDKDSRYWDVKFREDGEKDIRRRDDKYREDIDRDNRHGGDRDKYREDGDRDTRCREDKYLEHGNKDDRHHRDDKYREDDKDNRHKEEKHREDVDRDSKHRDAKQKNDSERERDKRARDVKYRDEHTSRDRTSESDTKRSRDEINVADLNYRKSSNRDISPIYDDRVTRYKEDKGRRRANDNEGHSDVRSRSTKEQHSDAEKRSISSSKVDLVTDRGRSNSRNTDVDINLNHIRHRSSPSSSTHAARDHYRVSKPEESKYRDYGFEERVRHNVNSSREFTGAGLTEKMSSSRSMEKSVQKDDIQIGELSADRRPRLDARASPLQMVNKSPSSTSTERRHLNRSDIRRTLDVEESGQRSGGSRDYSGREGKGSRELPIETRPVDEPSQVDGDNLSVSSPFNRNTNFSGNSRSHLPPPPPFRTGVDSSSVFGTSEDDNRGRSNNRHRRIGDSNMGRPQGNTWKGVPNWPSPVANGFIPFQHGPPPVGFHPVMQQFPAPPMFSVRPSMDMNHTLPYHMPDTDRFSGHGRPLSWRNPVDEHGWDANNAVFGDETHVYGRLDWDQNRTQMSNRGWDTSGDMWKGKNSGLSADMTNAPQKEDLARLKADEVLSGQSVQQAHIEQNQPNLQADNLDVQSSDALDNISDAPKNTPEENREISMMSVKDDVCPYHVYLSKLDISTDLIQPELYDQFTNLMDMDKSTLADEDNSKILYFEEVFEAKVADKSDSLFAAINDSVFQKAMSIYKKQREEIGAINREKVISSNLESLEVVQTYDSEKAASNDDKPGGLASCSDVQEAESAVPDYKEDVDMSSGLQEVEAYPTTACQKLDNPGVTKTLVVSEEQVSKLNVTEMEVDPVPAQEVVNVMVEDKSSSLKDVEQSDTLLPGNLEEMKHSGSPGGSHSPNNEGKKLIENKCDPLLFSDVSSGACEAVMPELIESGSVNLSRIHHSPESTH